jgi:hypothetical protein
MQNVTLHLSFFTDVSNDAKYCLPPLEIANLWNIRNFIMFSCSSAIVLVEVVIQQQMHYASLQMPSILGALV